MARQKITAVRIYRHGDGAWFYEVDRGTATHNQWGRVGVERGAPVREAELAVRSKLRLTASVTVKHWR